MSDVKVTIPRDDYNPNQRTDIDVEVVNPDGTVSTKTVKGAVQATTQEDGSVSFGILASAHVPFAAGGFSPDDIAGLVGWWEADAISGSDGDLIDTWTDATGTRNLTTSGASRPALKVGVTPSGENALRFDGSDDSLSATVLAQRTFSIVMCAKITGGDAARVLAYNGTAGASGAGFYATATNYYNLRGGVSETAHSTKTPDANWHVFAFVARDLTPDDTNLAVDNTFGAYRVENFNVPATRLAVMGELATVNAGGDVAAVFLYNQALTTTNFDDLNTYLTNKYL